MLYLSLEKRAAQSIAIQIREKTPVLQGIPVNLETIHIECRPSPSVSCPKSVRVDHGQKLHFSRLRTTKYTKNKGHELCIGPSG